MTILIGGVLANQRGRGKILCVPLNSMVWTLFYYELRSGISCFHVLDYWHKTSITESLASAERTPYCVIVSLRDGMFHFSPKEVRQEATEWSDKGGCLLFWVLVVCGGLKVSDYITDSAYHVSGPPS